MPELNRRQKIEEMLRQEPEDTFLQYSLAMEMSKAGEIEQAVAILEKLTLLPIPYVPAFFRSAQILAEETKIDRARTFLREGIEVARAQGDAHAAAEMGEMLADLGHA